MNPEAEGNSSEESNSSEDGEQARRLRLVRLGLMDFPVDQNLSKSSPKNRARDRLDKVADIEPHHAIEYNQVNRHSERQLISSKYFCDGLSIQEDLGDSQKRLQISDVAAPSIGG